MTEIRYLNVVELIIINEELIGGKSQLRDVDLLESAVLRPMTSAFGEDAYVTIHDKAAALFHSLSRNHAFVDGNKRTSVLATILFLELNGYTVTWDAEQALEFVLQIAQGATDWEVISEWLQANSKPS
ncbi:MAG: type II toxin-antitoxin system death-on-curing family toxin [Anaerolineae bacterium]|jgi:death-on-curing protein|nr:type II toxin-antitoxin system death-on-curing family toxin [Anaerolineae bacterium]